VQWIGLKEKLHGDRIRYMRISEVVNIRYIQAMERLLFEVVANIRLSSKNVSHMGFLDAQRALLGDQFPHG
jgi:hypothetical protein